MHSLNIIMKKLIQRHLLCLFCGVFFSSNLLGHIGSELASSVSRPGMNRDSNRDSYIWTSSSSNEDQRCFNRQTGRQVPTNLAFLICPKLREYNPKFIQEYSTEDESSAMILVNDRQTPRSRFVENQRQQALNILARAYNNPQTSANAKSLYGKLWNHLQYVDVRYPPQGQEYPFCKDNPGTAAFAYNGKMYFCNSTLIRETSVLDDIIHELAHLTGDDYRFHRDRECGAELITQSVFADAGRSPSQVAYAARCPDVRRGSRIQ